VHTRAQTHTHRQIHPPQIRTHAHAQEFTPWLKWLVFDSLLLLIVRFLSRRSTRLEALFEALGWL
jgi:hypothetical protein